MSLEIFHRFFTEMTKAYGDAPISITLPDTVYSNLAWELMQSRTFIPDRQLREPRQSHELMYVHANRVVRIIPKTRIEDYIECKLPKLLAGEICT